MSDDNKNPVPGSAPRGLKAAFADVAAYGRQEWKQSAALLTALLLGTTALATPLLASTAGAGALMLGSFFLLTRSSDALIDHARAIGKKINISPLILGLALGAFTSMPELFVSVGAVLSGTPDIGIGNIVGSNIANIMLIMGATAAITGVPGSKGASWKFNTLALLGATGVFGAQLMLGALTPIGAGAMLAMAGAYMYACHKVDGHDAAMGAAIRKRDRLPAAAADPAQAALNAATPQDRLPGWLNLAWGGLGLVSLISAANLVVGSATGFAAGIGVGEAVVGALAVAVGTSLPELMVNIKAALRRDSGMAIGNILGSNVFNTLVVGGAIGLTGITVPAAFGLGSGLGLLNLAAFFGSAALLGGALLKQEGGLKRWQGFAAMGLYAAFAAATMAMGDPGPAANAGGTALLPAPVPVIAPL